MDKVDIKPVNRGLELWQGVQPRLGLAPVIVRRPIARELLNCRQLHTLRPIGDKLLMGQSGGGDAPT